MLTAAGKEGEGVGAACGTTEWEQDFSAFLPGAPQGFVRVPGGASDPQEGPGSLPPGDSLFIFAASRDYEAHVASRPC